MKSALTFISFASGECLLTYLNPICTFTSLKLSTPQSLSKTHNQQFWPFKKINLHGCRGNIQQFPTVISQKSIKTCTMTAKNFTDPGAVVPCGCAGIFYFVEHFLLCFPLVGPPTLLLWQDSDRQGWCEGGAGDLDRKKHPGRTVLGRSSPCTVNRGTLAVPPSPPQGPPGGVRFPPQMVLSLGQDSAACVTYCYTFQKLACSAHKMFTFGKYLGKTKHLFLSWYWRYWKEIYIVVLIFRISSPTRPKL